MVGGASEGTKTMSGHDDFEGLDDYVEPVVEPKPVLIPRLFAALCRKSQRDGSKIKGQVVVMCKADVVKLWEEVASSRPAPGSRTFDCEGYGELVIRHPCIGGPRSSIKVKMGKAKPGAITFMSKAEYERRRKEWFK